MASNSATDADLPAVVDDILKGAAMSSLVEEDLVALVRDLRSARHAEQPPPSQLLPSPARPASHGEGMVAAGRHVANALGAGLPPATPAGLQDAAAVLRSTASPASPPLAPSPPLGSRGSRASSTAGSARPGGSSPETASQALSRMLHQPPTPPNRVRQHLYAHGESRDASEAKVPTAALSAARAKATTATTGRGRGRGSSTAATPLSRGGRGSVTPAKPSGLRSVPATTARGSAAPPPSLTATPSALDTRAANLERSNEQSAARMAASAMIAAKQQQQQLAVPTGGAEALAGGEADASTSALSLVEYDYSVAVEIAWRSAWATDDEFQAEEEYSREYDEWAAGAESRSLSFGANGSAPTAPGWSSMYVALVRPHRTRMAYRQWQRRVNQITANASLKRAAGALAARLARARALRVWSALRIAKLQDEIGHLHDVAQWHLNTLLGSTGMTKDPLDSTRNLLMKWSKALITAAFNSWRDWVKLNAEQLSKPLFEAAFRGWSNSALLKGWNVWCDMIEGLNKAKRVGARWRSGKIAAVWRTWKEMAAYRRAGQTLFAEMRMLPGAEMLKRWRHQRTVTSRINEAIDKAKASYERANMTVAMKCFKRVFASENTTGALTSVAGSFMRGNRQQQVFSMWAKAAREGLAERNALRAAVGRWHHQSLVFCFERMALLAANHQKLMRACASIVKGGLR